MYVHIFMYIYIYIGTYLLSEGSEGSSEIFFGPILGQLFGGKKIAINQISQISADVSLNILENLL